MSSRRRRRRRRRFTKRQLHNIRAIILRICCLAVLFLIVFGIVMGVRSVKKHFQAKKDARIEEIKQDIAADRKEHPVDEKSMKLVMVGDILLHESIENRSKQADGSYDYSDIFSHMRGEIATADVALVNEEVIIGGDDFGVRGYPSFNAPSDLTDALADTGFDVVLHATNHATDMGSTGISNCLQIWKEKHPEMEIVGIHATENDADVVSVRVVNGIRVAFLNYTALLNNELKSENSFMVDKLTDEREEKIRSDIQNAKKVSDFVVVCPHWGIEDMQEVTAEQEKWANVFLEEGVDLVIGTHPHIAQKIEMLKDEETGHEMLVYYSIGNFISWVSNGNISSVGHIIGGMPEVTIGTMADGSIGIQDYSIKATVCHFTGTDDKVVVYPYTEYNQELAAAHHIKQYPTNFTYDYIKEYLDGVWGDKWN